MPGAGFAEVKEFLEHDPSGMANGTEELLEFVDRILAEAVDELSGSHFDMPEPIRPLTTQIAPPGGPLMVYYMTPSEDFARPGGVWYSIGEQNQFPLYQHVSTAYHEGFPGHHLQLATAMYHKEDLSRAQRTLIFYPVHGEGWAMYAEVLMGELGYLENPKYYFGMLAKQMYRAARVVVDIGLHLGKPIAESSQSTQVVRGRLIPRWSSWRHSGFAHPPKPRLKSCVTSAGRVRQSLTSSVSGRSSPFAPRPVIGSAQPLTSGNFTKSF